MNRKPDTADCTLRVVRWRSPPTPAVCTLPPSIGNYPHRQPQLDPLPLFSLKPCQTTGGWRGDAFTKHEPAMFDWFHLIFVSISVRFLRLFTVRRCVHPLVCLCRRNGGLNTKSPDEAPRSKILHRFGSGVDFRFPLFVCVTALKGERLIRCIF